MRNLIALMKFTGFFLLCVVSVPPQIVVLLFHKGPYAYIIPRFFHKGVCFIFGIKVITKGQKPDQNQQVMYVSNHLSYLDIPVIGSVLKASFVAKEDVSGWPVFGFLSKMQQTAFISRDRNKAEDEKNNLDNLLKNRKSLILFPEGTSTDGKVVFPFKSSLFSIAYQETAKNTRIVPFTIKMVMANGKAIETQQDRDLYAWHVQMDTPLHTHLWHFAKSSGAVIALNFSPHLLPISYSDRKQLANAAQEAVSKGLVSI